MILKKKMHRNAIPVLLKQHRKTCNAITWEITCNAIYMGIPMPYLFLGYFQETMTVTHVWVAATIREPERYSVNHCRGLPGPAIQDSD